MVACGLTFTQHAIYLACKHDQNLSGRLRCRPTWGLSTHSRCPAHMLLQSSTQAGAISPHKQAQRHLQEHHSCRNTCA